MDISQVQTQQISTQANLAATREREVSAARSVSTELTETQQYETRQKYDTLELSDEGRAALNNSQMQSADKKSLAMSGAGMPELQQKEQADAVGKADAEKAATNESPIVTKTESEPVDNLSSYSKAELKQLLNTGAISQAEYDAEMKNREGGGDEEGNTTQNNQPTDNKNEKNTLGTNGKDNKSIGFGQEKK